MTQRRCLSLTVSDEITIKPVQLTFCVKLASEFELRIVALTEQNYVYIIESLLEKILTTNKPLSLVIDVSETIRYEYVRELFATSKIKFERIEF